ncbi:MAG: site-specific DNA-methyltransferase [Phycisphaeraceae bacterium]|nr:site-specific DNA-methyltransferase [Phycisphaeraceae bacterium]
MPAKTAKKPAAEITRNTIAGGDCIKTMRSWPNDSVDLVFADPPYNIGFSYDQYKDTLDDDKYIAWTCDWIDAAADLLKPTGSMYILIGDEYAAETRVHLKKLQKQGKLLFRNWIVWHYTFGQRCKIKFNRSHAHLFYCVGSAAVNKKTGKPKSNLTSKPPFTFNYDAVAVPSARMTTYKDARQNPKGKLPDDTWYQRFPNSKDWYQRPQDAIDDSKKLVDAKNDPDADELGGYFDPDCDTWYLSRLCGTFKEREQWHPCQLPEALLERIILTSSNEGDLVFDPFAGSGTTLAVANRLQRDWLGTELSADYRKKALTRIETAGEPEKKPRKVVTKNGKRPGRG